MRSDMFVEVGHINHTMDIYLVARYIAESYGV